MRMSDWTSVNERLEVSIEEMEAELAAGETAPIVVANRFIHSLDHRNFDERMGRLSPKAYDLIVSVAKDNILTFDWIIEDTRRAGGYPSLKEDEAVTGA